MDLFLDVLTHGIPEERPVANEYLNLITQRMNVGSAMQPLQLAGIPGIAGGAGLPRPPVPRPETPPRAEFNALPDRTRKDIEDRIKAKVRAYLDAIKETEGVRLLMADSNNPRALGIPTDVLFERGVVHQRSAARLLAALTGLVFSLGATQVILLPEGTTVGDSKILDMRRTIAISSHLVYTGVAPPRLRVNLLQDQVDMPKAMADFRGIVILFVYNQPLPLKPDHVLGEEKGPPLSLGVFPERFRPDQGQGVLIEFSVVEPPVGLANWRFKMQAPARQGADASTIQEVSGSASVFHQVYWNGRKGYWGSVFPEGRYHVSLSATDSRGRTRSVHRFITVGGPPKPKPKPRPKPKPAKKPKPVAVEAASPSPAVEAGETGAGDGSPSVTPENPPPVVPSQGKSPASGEGSAENRDPFRYQIAFNPGSQEMTPNGEQTLSQAANAMGVYPLAKLDLVGYASNNESDPEILARNRAQAVANVLIRKFSVDSKRIQIQSKVTAGSPPQVEIFIVAGKE